MIFKLFFLVYLLNIYIYRHIWFKLMMSSDRVLDVVLQFYTND